MTCELWRDNSVVSHSALKKALKGPLVVGFEACKIACDSTNAVHLRRYFEFNSYLLW